MRCPHCGREFEATGPSPGGPVACPACGKEFAEPNAPVAPPRASSGAGWGAIAIVVAGIAICGTAGCALGLVALFFPAVADARAAANRSICQGHLKQIVLAMHNYHDTYKVLPSQSIVDENGRPMHSWRTVLLPFLEESRLYERYDFDEPWDSPNNLAVGEERVPTYVCPSHDDSNETSYFVVYGDETMFGPNRWTKLSEAPDGLSNTILIVEATNLYVPWSQPVDIPFDDMQFKLNSPDASGVSSDHPGGVNAAFGDGSVKFLSDSIDEETFRYALIKDDGVSITPPE